MQNITKAQILSVGQYLPDEVVKSDDLFSDFGSEVRYGIPENWMSEQMGIKERRMAPRDAKPSEIALPAARQALFNSGLQEIDIDLVIFCGIERDMPEPATAHVIADQLGLAPRHAFDVANACYGFVDGLQLASQFIASGVLKHALVVTGEITTNKVLLGALEALKNGVDVKQAKKLIGMLSVGDAGGALVLGPSHNGTSGFEAFNAISQSRHQKKCYYKFKDGTFDGQMEMAHLSALMISNHDKMMEETMDQLGWPGFDWLLSHQIGEKPFERIREISGIKRDKMVKTLPYLGNITTATLPVGFYKLSKNANLREGDRIGGCFAGSGIVIGQFGYTY